jgi:hypothetical protein
MEPPLERPSGVGPYFCSSVPAGATQGIRNYSTRATLKSLRRGFLVTVIFNFVVIASDRGDASPRMIHDSNV